MRKLARKHRAAVLIGLDGGVTTYAFAGDKVRARLAEPGSDEARWLTERFERAGGGWMGE